MIRKRRRPPLDTLHPRRICLIKPSALGDIVQTLPVLSALRARWPQAHIAWVVKDCFADLLADHPELDQIVTFKPNPIGGALVREMFRLFRVLHREPYDLAIDLQGLLRSGGMAWASGAPRRVGFSCGREGSTWCYTDSIEIPPQDMPVTQRYWKVVSALGGPPEVPAARIGIRPAHERWAQEQLQALPRPVLAIHPGAGWLTKRWPARHFARIAEMVQRTFGGGIVLVGGNDCRQEGAEIASRCSGPVLDLTARTTLRQLAALLASTDVVLSGDSGPMHLAAAVGAPVVSLFTCTNVTRHAPFGQESRVVSSHVHCAASHRKTCPSMICMDELTPFRVWPMLSQTLQEACARLEQPAVRTLRAAA
jgi:heptosyltransferase-2